MNFRNCWDTHSDLFISISYDFYEYLDKNKLFKFPAAAD